MLGFSHGTTHLLIATKTVEVFYSFWNLDLLRPIIPDICLNVTTLQGFSTGLPHSTLSFCADTSFIFYLLSFMIGSILQ